MRGWPPASSNLRNTAHWIAGLGLMITDDGDAEFPRVRVPHNRDDFHQLLDVTPPFWNLDRRPCCSAGLPILGGGFAARSLVS